MHIGVVILCFHHTIDQFVRYALLPSELCFSFFRKSVINNHNIDNTTEASKRLMPDFHIKSSTIWDKSPDGKDGKRTCSQ